MGRPFSRLSHDPCIEIRIQLAIDKVDTVEMVVVLTRQLDREQTTHHVKIFSSDKINVVGLPDFVRCIAMTKQDGSIGMFICCWLSIPLDDSCNGTMNNMVLLSKLSHQKESKHENDGWLPHRQVEISASNTNVVILCSCPGQRQSFVIKQQGEMVSP